LTLLPNVCIGTVRLKIKKSSKYKFYSKNEYYFIEELKLDDNEVFVDFGAYDGDTINDFFKHSLRIAEYIHDLLPEYKLYVRQHLKFAVWETVLYALPL